MTIPALKIHWKQQNQSKSRLGGKPLLSPGQNPPQDKRGEPLEFLLQIDFAEVAKSQVPISTFPSEGLLLLFVNSRHDFSNPKDRFSYSVVWQPDSEKAVETHCASAISTSAGMSFSPEATTDEDDYLFGNYKHPQSEHAREIAAFAANGISWNQTRRQDSCYAHLVEAAQDWLPLARIQADKPGRLALTGVDLLLLTSRQDLSNNQLNRTKLVAIER